MKMLVPVLALIMLIGACNKEDAKETKETTAETTTEATTTEEEEEIDDDEIIDDEDDDDSAFVEFDYSDWIPDQNIEIDEKYLKFYDYDTFYSATYCPVEHPIESADELTNDVLKEVSKQYFDGGYSVTPAEDNASFLRGQGISDDEGRGIAYLYNGFIASKETDTSYEYVECYIASQEIIDKMNLVKGDEKDGVISYADDPTKLCPSDAVITYDPETELLTYVTVYTYDADMAPVG